jgi:hypothetical protein
MAFGAAIRELGGDGGVAEAVLPGDVDAVDAAERHLRVQLDRRTQEGVGVADVAVVRDHEDRQADTAGAHAQLVIDLGLGEGPRQLGAEVVFGILAHQALAGERQPAVDGVVGLQAEVRIDAGGEVFLGAAGLVRTAEFGLVAVGPGQGASAEAADAHAGRILGVSGRDGQRQGEQSRDNAFFHGISLQNSYFGWMVLVLRGDSWRGFRPRRGSCN